jgi:hypothetical protein
MKALILYVIFVAIGGLISSRIGPVSWVAVILAMHGSLDNALGAQEQLDIVKAGRARIATRETSAIAARKAKRV